MMCNLLKRYTMKGTFNSGLNKNLKSVSSPVLLTPLSRQKVTHKSTSISLQLRNTVCMYTRLDWSDDKMYFL